MVNLLPQKEIRTLKRTYYVRLTTVLVVLLNVAIVIGGVLLIPSYVVSERAADSAERYLAAVEETIGVRERAGVTEEVRALTERLRILNTFTETPSSVEIFEVILSNAESSVRITGIGFAKGEDAINVSVAGVSTNRTTLLAFVDRLRTSGTFDGIEVPVSQLAQDSNIPFSITATYRSAP